MKVLVVHNVLWSHYKGAVFSALYKLAREKNIDVKFVQIAETFAQRKALSEVDLSFHEYPYTLLFKCAYHDVSGARRAVRLVSVSAASKADIIVVPGYEDISYWALWLFCIIARKRIILTLDSTQSDHARVWYKELIKKIFVSQCDGAFCYGLKSAQYVAMLGMESERIMRRCQAAPNDYLLKIAINSRSELAAGSPGMRVRKRFLFVGRLSPEKGLLTLLQAFRDFNVKVPGFDLYLVGAGTQRPELEQRVRELGIESAVIFAGPKKLDQLVEDYLTAFALILPSTSEPWGLVVNEAFLMRCPAIVSDRCGCTPDLIVEGHTGYQFPVGDTEALTGAMLKMASQIEHREEMGQACFDIIQQFTPEEAAGQMLRGMSIIGSLDNH